MKTDNTTRGVTAGPCGWNSDMLASARIGATSRVLEINSGTEDMTEWITHHTGASAHVVDVSSINSTRALPFPDASFTHVIRRHSVGDPGERLITLAEIARVLEPEGIYASDQAGFSPRVHGDELSASGFVVYDHCRGLSQGGGFVVGQKVPDRLAWIYQPDSHFSLEHRYDAWAAHYDADLNESYSESPRQVAALLACCLPPRNVAVLDAGAGTGMVGENLRAIGYSDVTALDNSRGMLARAREKSVYQRLVLASISEAPAAFGCATFDAVTAVGVFTFAHAQPTDIVALDAVLRPGGWLMIAVRIDYLAEHHTVTEILDSLGYTISATNRYVIFGDEPMVAMACRKPTIPRDRTSR